MRTFLLVRLLPGLLACSLLPAPARCVIPDLVWEDPEVVDLGVPAVSGPAGPAMAHTPAWSPWTGLDEWHVVYAKDGQILHAVRDANGWWPPEQLSLGTGPARDPRLAFGGAILHVVWEDDRTGHPEVWTRRWDGASWSAEECLTCDAASSRSPVISGTQEDALLAWQEGPDPTSAILSRAWSGGAWGPVEAVSNSPAAAAEPTVSGLSFMGYRVAWSDARHGLPEIYLRDRRSQGEWAGEVRVTDMPGSCRHPSSHTEVCCGDMIAPSTLIAFENDQTGRNEIWITCCLGDSPPTTPQEISAGDQVASERPSVGGFTFMNDWGMFSRTFVTWTDRTAPNAYYHPIDFFDDCGSLVGGDLLSTAGRSLSGVAAIDGSPTAGVMAQWIETRDGQPALIARTGSLPGCRAPRFNGPAAILLTPSGDPGNTIRARDNCAGGAPLAHVGVSIEFSSDLDQRLVWDPRQAHPNLPEQNTDEQGATTFAIRGGGCSATGTVSAHAMGVEVLAWSGAKSPDVNGDCAVTSDDLAYVQSRLGTADFCADLDGSGHVDAADVAIVQAAMGERCLDPGGLVDPRGAPIGISVAPNPCRDASAISLLLTSPGKVSACILDAAGRRIRDLATEDLAAGFHSLAWDTRDDAGRAVSAGVYFVSVRVAATRVHRAIVVVR